MALAPDRAQDSIGRLIEALETRLEDITETIVAAHQVEIPSYAAASPEVIDEVRANTKRNIRTCAAVLRGDVDLSTLRLPHAESARRRAAEGFPLHEVLLSYQLGARIFWEKISDVFAEDPVGWTEVAPGVVALTLELVRSATAVIAKSYLEFESARIADEEHDFQSLVESLAGIREPDAMVAHRAARRRVELDAIGWCAVTELPREETAEKVQELRRRLDGSAVGRVGEQIVIYLPAAADPSLSLDGPTGLVEESEPGAGYRRARAAFEVAQLLGRKLVRYEEVMPLALVLEGPPEMRAAFVSSQLGRVLADPMGTDLLASLEAYYASGQSLAAAARALHVHRHTLEYRLKRVGELLGADLKDSGRRLLLELALALRR